VDTDPGDDVPQTWHHGLMARWWAEFKEAEPLELEYYGAAIARFGEPALDLACGVGRLLVPLLEAGVDIDGVDVSGDMLDRARELAEARGLNPSLMAQAMHRLDLPRRYRTIFICDSFGIGVPRRDDLIALHRVYEHLEPGGALVLSHELPYSESESGWLEWLPGRSSWPEPWPERGERRAASDGDELEIVARQRAWDPLLQQGIRDVRARRWRERELVEQEEHAILLTAYFAQEIVLMLERAGFTDIEIQGRYTGAPATADDTTVMFIATRPA
jgi:SAM-dependent methyltransferase